MSRNSKLTSHGPGGTLGSDGQNALRRAVSEAVTSVSPNSAGASLYLERLAPYYYYYRQGDEAQRRESNLIFHVSSLYRLLPAIRKKRRWLENLLPLTFLS
jgi:hypothetical protein